MLKMNKLEHTRTCSEILGCDPWLAVTVSAAKCLPPDPEECHIFMDAADRSASVGSAAGKFYSNQPGLNRSPDPLARATGAVAYTGEIQWKPDWSLASKQLGLVFSH